MIKKSKCSRNRRERKRMQSFYQYKEGRQQEEEMQRVQYFCLPSCLQVWELACFLGSWEPDMGEHLQMCYKTGVLLAASISKQLNKAAHFSSTQLTSQGRGIPGNQVTPKLPNICFLKVPFFKLLVRKPFGCRTRTSLVFLLCLPQRFSMVNKFAIDR